MSSPFLWGLLGSAAFFGLVHAGVLAHPFIVRYFTGHVVEYAETVLFAIGLAVLVLRALDIVGQRSCLGGGLAGTACRPTASLDERCRSVLDSLERLPAERRDDYYPRRWRAAVERIRSHGSTEGLGDELKYLAEHDAGRLQNGYGLFHVIIWAIPILGFLGTVIGITMALNGLDPNALDESMAKVVKGLGVKFDTTALALGMAMVLMFVYFFVHRLEGALLEEVDRCVASEAAERFPTIPSGPNGQLAMMQQMADAMSRTAEQLLQRTAGRAEGDDAAHWNRLAEAMGRHLKQALSESLASTMDSHAKQLAAAEQAAAEQNRRHWEKVRQSHAESLRSIGELQAEMSRQAGVLARVAEITGEVTKLQDVLNRNLTALGGAKHIEQTVSGLAAAIHLLNARLAESPSAASHAFQLEPNVRSARVA